MWTPKRIVLLALGFALLLSVYFVYSHFLGGIDGLPPLPEAFLPPPGGKEVPIIVGPVTAVEEKLKMAFGPDCPELKRAIKLEVPSRGLVLSTDDCVIAEGGLRLKPVSLALFNKKTPRGKFPEINTVRSKVGYLKFDRPIANLADCSSRKIVAGELSGDEIIITNNRRKPVRDDQLHIRIWEAPLFYDEVRHLIWTEGRVHLQDLQTKPLPTEVRAKGMELHLTVEDAPGGGRQPAPRKPRNETVSGVDRIVLKSDVMMDLYVGSNFLSTGPEKPADKPAAPKPSAPATANAPTRSHVFINTEGPFVYDVGKDLATFDIPRTTNQLAVHQVMVVRDREEGKHDRLECQHLELEFLRKNKEAAGGASAPAVKKPAANEGEERSMDLEIQTAHATGKDLLLTSDDTEALEARGTEFLYHAPTSKITIRGDPDPNDPDVDKNRLYGMWASKGASKIRARELQVVNQTQEATALGPGDIRLCEKPASAPDKAGASPGDSADARQSVRAQWKDKLISSKEGGLDLLTLTGEAAFVDEEHGQELRGDTLKVWLEPPPAKDAATPRAAAAPQSAQPQTSGRRPRRVEASGSVTARSREMHVHDTDKLVLFFKDAPARLTPPANAPAPGREAAKPAAPTLPTPSVAVGQPGPAAPAREEPAKPPRPIDLSARLVEAHVIRLSNNKNELEKLWTEGRVHVHQEPEKPEDRGIDIEGDTLQLTHFPAADGRPEGNKLTVTASGDDMAKLNLDKMSIWGPEVNIDQVKNEAWVDGQGVMWMKSDQDFQGKKLKRPVPMEIHWYKFMRFYGDSAEFFGGIQAKQENARLACQDLYVALDRMVSLREGDKKGQPPAKVRTIVCDKRVLVEDEEHDEQGRLLKHQRIQAIELKADNEDGTVQAVGPGVVRIFQPGTAEVMPAGPNAPGVRPAPPGPRPANEEMKLTRVTYTGLNSRMWANNKTHTAIFDGEIEVVHMPAKDKNEQPNVTNLPPDTLQLHCERRLTVYSRSADGRSDQRMVAEGKATATSQEFIAKADRISSHQKVGPKPEENKDQVVFEGLNGQLAHVSRFVGKGLPRQEMRAKTIIYNRKTRQFFMDGADKIEGQ